VPEETCRIPFRGSKFHRFLPERCEICEVTLLLYRTLSRRRCSTYCRHFVCTLCIGIYESYTALNHVYLFCTYFTHTQKQHRRRFQPSADRRNIINAAPGTREIGSGLIPIRFSAMSPSSSIKHKGIHRTRTTRF